MENPNNIKLGTALTHARRKTLVKFEIHMQDMQLTDRQTYTHTHTQTHFGDGRFLCLASLAFCVSLGFCLEKKCNLLPRKKYTKMIMFSSS